MTHTDPLGGAPAAPAASDTRPYWRIAVWVAIGALIAAGLVCVVWVLVGGSQNGLIARAFLTILLLAGFAAAALFDASVSARREQWYVLVSMVGWVVILLAGALKIWVPLEPFIWSDTPFSRFFQLVGIALVVRLAILHTQLFLRAVARERTTFTQIVGYTTVALVTALAILLVVPMLFPRVDYGDFYWRMVVAVSILAAIGTALVPLVRALNSPRRTAAAPVAGPAYQGYGAPQGYAAVPAAPPAAGGWPTYADARTPLPVMPDGSPDWNAYYTGYPTYPQHATQAPVGEHFPAPAQQHTSYGQDLGVSSPQPPQAPAGQSAQASGGEGQATNAQSFPPVPPAPPVPPQS